MNTYLFKFLKGVIVLSLVCFLFDTVSAENIGLKSGDNVKTLQLPKATKNSAGEKIAPAAAVKVKVAIGKPERARIKLQLRETQTLSNNGVSKSSSASEYNFDRASAQKAIKPAVEMAPKVSTPKISKAASVSTAKPAKIDFLK